MERLTILLVLAYGLASVLYLVYAARTRESVGRWARVAMAAGWALQVVDIGARCFQMQHPASSTSEATAFIAWMVAGGFLVASLKYRLHSAGAFAAPATLAMVLLARVVPAPGAAAPAGPLGLTHVFLATVGVATFALAAVLEVVYLIQERRLKRKEFQRLRAGAGTPLDTLDRLAGRCVSFGFPVFTLAIITGALWVARLGVLRTGGTVRPEYVLAVASWIAFAVLLVARAGAGWQGRRAAWLTVGGFSGVMLVVAAYFLRSVV